MSTGVSEKIAMQLSPYVFFYGRCEEALEFYKKALGGEYQAQRQENDKIMHSIFTAPGITLLCSDGNPERDGERVDPNVGNVALALNVGDRAKGERVFNALAEGGRVVEPLKEVPWGDHGISRFGAVHDKFGNEWMVTTP